MGYSRIGEQGFQSTHCLTGHPLYKTWNKIKHRCYNKNNKDYKHYGGRNIVMCEVWLNDFIEFFYWSFKNGWEKGLTIERIDVNGNYDPSNCKWVPMCEQAKNRRGLTALTYRGETKTASEWARIAGMSSRTLRGRLERGNYSIEDAIEVPVNEKLSRKNFGNGFYSESIETGERKYYKFIVDVVMDGLSPSSVSKCLNGKQKQHKGHIFKLEPYRPKEEKQ